MKSLAVHEVIEWVFAAYPSAVIVSTCGFISRDVQAACDLDTNFYLVGAMGMALPVGLGIAVARPNVKVVVIDGDGSASMNIGALIMVGAERPPNLVHVVLDNGVHESTGGQATLSVAWLSDVARSFGYRGVHVMDGNFGQGYIVEEGPTMLHIRVARRVGSPKARIRSTPFELTRRFSAALGSGIAVHGQTE